MLVSCDMSSVQLGRGASPHADDLATPLVVDLDGTLLKSDVLVESAIQLLRRNLLLFLRMLFWAVKGKAYLKEQVAHRVQVGTLSIPYHSTFLSFLKTEAQRGRPIFLATASNARAAAAIAERLGIFHEVLASDARLNLAGTAKLDAILTVTRGLPFDYAGNSRTDLPIWRRSRYAILVNPGLGVERAARRCSDVAAVFDDRSPSLSSYPRAIRIHQWLKNLLIGVPLLTSHSWSNSAAVITLALAFVSFGLGASATYLLNDLLDLPADRQHPRKSHRALASGDMPVMTALGLMIGLFSAGIALAAAVSLDFLLVLLLYIGLTISYSISLKTFVIVDVITLASLYTLRIVAGTAAIGVALSSWLLAFSMFLFLSLALVKRCSELRSMEQLGLKLASGRRDYRVSDISILGSMGIAAGYVAVLVLALFVESPHSLTYYAHPERLWLLCPPMAYWISTLWVKTSRGEMHDDPLVYSVRDKVTWLIVGSMTTVVFLAL